MSREMYGFRKEAQRLNPDSEDYHHEDDFSTAVVDDDCDALNDKTFEEGVHVAGVECHDKVAKLEDRAKHPLGSSPPANPLDGEDSFFFQDVVQRSISRLGLDDDEGKPAITTHYKATVSSGTARWRSPRSPPPPVFLQQRSDGSPMMETIWTPKPALPFPTHDQLKFLPWKLQDQQQRQRTQEEALPELQPPGRSSSPPNMPKPEDLERDKLGSVRSHPVPVGSTRRESPSGSTGTHAERLEGGDFVGPSSHPSHLSGATTNQGAPPPARSGSVNHRSHVLIGPPSSDQPRTPQVRFSPGWSAYPPGTHAGPVLPAPTGMPLQNGRIPGPAHEGMSSGIPPDGFGNKMSLPALPHTMLTHGKVIPQCSPMFPNNPSIRGRIPPPSNRPGFQPGMTSVSFEPQNTGSSPHNQKPSYQTVFGNPETSGMPPTVFGNRMPLPPTPDPLLGPGGAMIPPSSSMLLKNPAIRGRMPLPSNLPDLQPGMNQVSLDPPSSGRRTLYQQHAFETVFGNQGRPTYGSPSTGFSNRVPLPPSPNPMLSPGWGVMPPHSARLPNDPAMGSRMPLSSNPPGFQPERNQVQPQNSGSSYDYQQHAYQTVFGDFRGATLGSPLQTGGVQQQIWRPYPRARVPGGPLDYRDGRNGSFHQVGNVVAVSNSPTIVKHGS